MRIVVLVKQVPDTWSDRKLSLDSGWVDRDASEPTFDEVGERALEVALQYQDAHGAEVIALTMGPANATDMLRKALAIGADSAVHIVDNALAGADVLTTARTIAAALRKTGFDLVIAGNESTDGRGGVMAAVLAELLEVPHASFLNASEITASSVTGERATDHGIVNVSTSLPAVISVTEQAPEARFAGLRNLMKAKKKPITQYSLADLGVEAGSHSAIRTVTVRPPRVAGPKVADDGTAVDQLVEFLATRHLV